MTLIAQITDCHIGFDRDDPEEDNVQRLRGVLARLRDGRNRPDLLLITGDLTGYGEAENYARLAGVIADQPFPVHLMLGNWDRREVFCATMPESQTSEGFVQFEIALPGLRLIALDTNEAGRHGGGFCKRRAEWLSAQLDVDRQTPVVIAMHHPPVETGIAWLDSGANEAWIQRFAGVIEGRPQIRAIVSGHMHRPIFTTFAGVPLVVCPSSAPHVELDLSPLDPETPDGRPLVVDDPAGYALHRWDGQRLVSHFEWIRPGEAKAVYASFDASMAGAVSQNARERRE